MILQAQPRDEVAKSGQLLQPAQAVGDTHHRPRRGVLGQRENPDRHAAGAHGNHGGPEADAITVLTSNGKKYEFEAIAATAWSAL